MLTLYTPHSTLALFYSHYLNVSLLLLLQLRLLHSPDSCPGNPIGQLIPLALKEESVERIVGPVQFAVLSVLGNAQCIRSYSKPIM